MNGIIKFGTACALTFGSAALVGCVETVKKDETVRTNSDGSQTKTVEETVKEADGTLKTEMTGLTHALQQRGIKLGVRRAYTLTFDRLRAGLLRAQGISGEIQSMLTGTFRQLNAEYGFSLQAPKEPDLARYARDLELVERSSGERRPMRRGWLGTEELRAAERLAGAGL